MRHKIAIGLLGFIFMLGLIPGTVRGESGRISVTVPVLMDNMLEQDGGDEVSISGYGYLREPGCPRLPARIYAVAIPPGAVYESLSVRTGTPQELDGIDIPPAPAPRTIETGDVRSDSKESRLFEDNQRAVYGSDDLYPAAIAEYVRSGGFRKYNIVDIRVSPYQYRPVSGTLVYYPDITLDVHYRMPVSSQPAMIDNQPRMEQRAQSLILNYDQAQAWYPSNPGSRGLYEYVLITTSALQTVAADLVDWEIIKGRTATSVTTEWINSTYPGVDLAQKMRNFLREKYPSAEWGIEDVCLVGAMANVPMRHISDDPDTDFYFAELSLPDNQSWDANSNQVYLGSGDSCDFYSEVNVGRIPWSTPSTVQHVVEKTIAYEMTDDPSFKKNVLLIGTFFWDDTDNAVLMEAKVDQPGMEDWTMTRMYEVPQSSYSCDYNASYSNVQSVWTSNTFAFVNWAGHGSATACYELYPSQPFVDTSICPLLDDNYPAIIFADACSNSETSEISIGARMIEQGAVGFVGSTRVAYGCPGWSGPSDGSSQSLDYFFSSGVMSGGMTQGESMQNGLTQVYQMNGWDYTELEMCEWTLYGNPDLGMDFALSSDGTIMFDMAQYQPDSFAVVTVRDLDLDENPGGPDTVPVTLSSDNGDTETFVLTETGNSTFVFQDTVTISEGSAVVGNGILEVQHGNQIQAVYIDEDDGHGGVNIEVTATAVIDGVPPQINNVEVTGVSYSQAVIHWVTDEESDSVVFYGTDFPTEEVSSSVKTTDHVISLTGLLDCTEYVFYVQSTDIAGNTTIEDNGGDNYSFVTWEQVVYFSDDMESGPGAWTHSGLWHHTNASGSCPENHSGVSSWYYGQEPQCNYDVGTTEGTLTSELIDLTAITDAEYHVWYWHEGEEYGGYDILTIQIQVQGQSVINLLTVEGNSGGWQEYVLDMNDYVGHNIYLKFNFNSVDGMINDYRGSYIDDVVIFSSAPCSEPTATPDPCINSGDVNLNGEITAGDAQMAFQIALGTYVPSDPEWCAADCNADEDVTAGDAQSIFLAALGLGSCADPL
ncbi:hypothetical protein JW823_00645 [bacterium]|nr:hypothetical protein [candidate division CSSED10-310 bacterium]